MAKRGFTVAIKRVYDQPEPGDGTRILVDRLWPRGLSKERAKVDAWLKEVAPSNDLRKWFGHDPEKFAEFRRRYEAELAHQRYLRVHPDHRLVADSLEADWNRKLCALQEAQQQYERESQKDRLAVDEELRTRLHMLATDFPHLWRDPNTPDRERKRLAYSAVSSAMVMKINF